MPAHDRFEELCALAASGQIEPGEWQELQEHMQSCSSCMETLGAFGRIGADLLAGFAEAVPPGLREEMRSRFLNRMREQAADMGSYPPAVVHREPRRWRPFALIGLAAALVLAFVGIAYLKHPTGQSPNTRAQSSLPALPATQSRAAQTVAVTPRSDESEKFVATIHRIESERAALEGKLNAGASRETDLRARIADLDAQLEARNRELTVALSERANASQRLAQAELALEQSASRQAGQERQIGVARAELQSLSDQLAIEKTSAAREKALLAAGKDGQSIIAARNLHIVDVYDADGRGKRRSFGRVFYVEGQELVFYAYDLSDPRHANAEFYAWGAGTAPGQSAMRLGILHNDGKNQQRWVLRYSDTNVLARLNSIFVTAETASNPEKPKGRRVLFAVLAGQPNHP